MERLCNIKVITFFFFFFLPLYTFSLAFKMKTLPLIVSPWLPCFSTSSAISKCHSALFPVRQMAFSTIFKPSASAVNTRTIYSRVVQRWCVLTPAATLSTFWKSVWLLIHADSVKLGLNSFSCFSSTSSSQSCHWGSIQSTPEHNSHFPFLFCVQHQFWILLIHLFLQHNGCRVWRQVGY